MDGSRHTETGRQGCRREGAARGGSLPREFTERMEQLLGPEYRDFIESYENSHLCGLRVNTLKLSPQRFAELSPFELRSIPWIDNGFYYSEKEQPAKHPYYYAGLYYIQEPSAMTPASLLPVKPGDRVLDLCAAPGGKSTELAARLEGQGVLVANDISNSRAKALLKNIELFGVRNAVVASEPPARLEEYFGSYFDCILVDAPCSGEGMFRKSPAVIKNWQQYGTEYYARLQRDILPHAVRMLRPGGYLLYSTCTFSPPENEGALKFILENFPDMHVIPAIPFSHENACLCGEGSAAGSGESAAPAYEGFAPAVPEYVLAPAEVANALRLYPHRIKGEGHFVALLRKEGGGNRALNGRGDENGGSRLRTSGSSAQKNAGNRYDRAKYRQISGEAFDFLESVGFEIPAEGLEARDGRLYLLPEGLPPLKGLRVLRSGLLLGEMKKNRFEPSQALACALRAEEYGRTFNMSMAADSEAVVRYLKCESLQIPGNTGEGYVLVCVDGFPLGWGKCSHGLLKNKYLSGWRMM